MGPPKECHVLLLEHANVSTMSRQTQPGAQERATRHLDDELIRVLKYSCIMIFMITHHRLEGQLVLDRILSSVRISKWRLRSEGGGRQREWRQWAGELRHWRSLKKREKTNKQPNCGCKMKGSEEYFCREAGAQAAAKRRRDKSKRFMVISRPITRGPG
jgi:hypothetical protein